MHRTLSLKRMAAVLALLTLLAACGGGTDAADEGGGSEAASEDVAGAASDEADAESAPEAGGAAPEGTGPISIWYSNNPQEIAWGEAVVEAWNAENPDAQVDAQEIPAGESSEAVITAAIAAGNTPCLIYNTAPAAVSEFQKQGGLVALDSFEDGLTFANERVGEERLSQYVSQDGSLYQMPWKTNPSMIFYNREIFEAAGVDADNPPLATYDEFLETSQTLVDSGEAEAAIWPSPDAQFFQSWFDFYPLFIANSGGQQLVEDGEPQFTSEAGLEVAAFWRSMYEAELIPNEAGQGDTFAEGQAAMSIVGPWAVAVYGEDIDWGVVPVPTPDGTAPEEIFTFSDNKSVALYSSCENQASAWEFLKFSVSEESDGVLLEETGQMPMRVDLTETYADYFTANPDYETFADQASRTVEVPNVPNSIAMWQEFRDAYTESVIFGETEASEAFEAAASEITDLVAEG